MNEINFIKEHGVDKAREVVGGAPEGFKGYNDVINKYTRGVWFSRDVLLSDLKRLVGSVDLVNLKGGVKKLKKEADCLFHNDVEGVALRYEQAIADYEAIYSGVHQ